MKAFLIFPMISVFVLMLTIFMLDGRLRSRAKVLWSAMATAISGGLMIGFSADVVLPLYDLTFLSIVILVPCLTYLMNRLFKNNSGKWTWVRILGLGLFSTALAIVIFAATFLVFILDAPMDPAPRVEKTENSIDLR
jgi:hypothetical protein